MKMNKNQRVIFRVQPQMKALLDQQWKESGKRNKSDFLRSLIESSVMNSKSVVSSAKNQHDAFVGVHN